MKRFIAPLFFLTALLLVVGTSSAEVTRNISGLEGQVRTGVLLFSSLDHSSELVASDTLLGAASDTTSNINVAGAKTVTLWANVSKRVSTGDITVSLRTSPDGSTWSNKRTISADSLDCDATGTRVYPLLVQGLADTSAVYPGTVAAEVAGANYIDFVITKADGAAADSAMVNMKYSVGY